MREDRADVHHVYPKIDQVVQSCEQAVEVAPVPPPIHPPKLRGVHTLALVLLQIDSIV